MSEFLSLVLVTTLVCIALFFIRKDPRFGFAAAVLLAGIPVVQLIMFAFSPPIDASVNKVRMLAVPLMVLFDLVCAACAGIMFHFAKRLQDRQ